MNKVDALQDVEQVEQLLETTEGKGYKRYSEYKDSGMKWINQIPSHWSTIKLKFISDIKFSNVNKHSIDEETPIRLCNYTDVYYNDVINNSLGFMKATASEQEIKRFKIQDDDVVITKDSEDPTDIAVPALVKGSFDDLLCGYHLALIRPDHNKCIGSFLLRAFSAEGIRQQFNIAASGVTRYGLPKQALNDSLFPLPPLEEQQAIARFLDEQTGRIDELIAAKRKLLDLLHEKRRAIITHAVTKGLDPDVQMKDSGVEWLGEVPEHWGVKRIKYICSSTSGFTPDTKNLDYWDGDIPWVSPKDMKHRYIYDTEDQITELAVEEVFHRKVDKESVLIVVRSGILKHTIPVAINKVSVEVNQDIWALKTNRIYSSEFLAWIIEGNQDTLLKIWRKPGTTVQSIESQYFFDTYVPMPPLEEQQEINKYLDEQTSKISEIELVTKNAIERLKELRVALISSAVMGEINVIKTEYNDVVK